MTLVVDTFRPPRGAAFEAAVEVAASLVASCAAVPLPLQLITTDGRSVRGRGMGADGQAMLDLLADVERTCRRGTLLGVTSHLATEHRGDVLLVVTGAAGVEEMAAVGALGSRFRSPRRRGRGDRGGRPAWPSRSLPNLRVVRVTSAADFGAGWEQVALR